jgi:hypothetical protein
LEIPTRSSTNTYMVSGEHKEEIKLEGIEGKKNQKKDPIG